MELKYGSRTFDTTKLPETSLLALMTKGLNHYFGNEAASRVSSAIRKAIAESVEPHRKTADVTTDEIKAFREANVELTADLAKKVETEFAIALLDGTVGARAGGTATPRDPFEAECRRLATIVGKSLVASLQGADGKVLKWPRGEEKITFGDKVLDGEEIISLILAGSKGEAIRKDAQKNLAATKKIVAGASGDSAEALFG